MWAWEELITLQTYPVGKPEKNPLFLEKRVYQGSSGAVYPHPVIEKINDEITDQQYTAVFIENEYLKIMILPGLGGRIHRAYDKVRQRDFVYYNEVIKPALVGLTGPWISGGIEFNWPQHHRPGTFEPVDYCIKVNDDGSKTVWINELEIMTRTKGMAGFTLYPGRAYLEISGKLFNRTTLPQSFLWWANPAVKVNDYYQSIFPPDVYAVFDHGKRDVSGFPMATGTYYKVDYSPGTDISLYKNIPVPTSYMAIHSGYDFIGCYEHDTEAGMLHVANHHISPGKKQWTWGNGDFGKAWDRNLTDHNGPYIELMAGIFTDNQPDFTWLKPNEQKEFEQYFLPYAKTGGVKNASKEALINLVLKDEQAEIKIYATAKYPNALITFWNAGERIADFHFDLSPADTFSETIPIPGHVHPADLKITVEDAEKNILIAYKNYYQEDTKIPSPAAAPKPPLQILSNEELYFTGLHLEQYRHATFNPSDYYSEALRRDPADYRCNNAMGLLFIRCGQFKKAEYYLRQAISAQTRYNPNPGTGEAYYNLGLSLLFQNRDEEAYPSFYKATWDDAMQHSGFLALAKIHAKKLEWKEALKHVNMSLARNTKSHSAMHLQLIILRKLERKKEFFQAIDHALQSDQFNYGALYEKYLMLNKYGQKNDAVNSRGQLQSRTGNRLNSYLEYALDYASAGCYKEALELLEAFSSMNTNHHPLLYYYKGWLADLMLDKKAARDYFQRGANCSPDYCFPNKLEEILIFKKALEYEPADAWALYFLGNLWYDKRQYDEAIDCWEKSVAYNSQFPTSKRNLGLALFNKKNDKERSLFFMEKAFSLDKNDARILMELDQLYKTLNKPLDDRLSFLEDNRETVNTRDDLYLELITLYNLSGEFRVAEKLLASRKFHPWEGGEGKVTGQYVICQTGLARNAIIHKRYNEAVALLSGLKKYPVNLGEGKLHNQAENDIDYLLGLAFEGMSEMEHAKQHFEKAASGISEPVQAIFYNDSQPDKILYQGLAHYKLGSYDKASAIFKRLISFGEEHAEDDVSIDYFAVSLPDLLVFEQDLLLHNHLHCIYMIALGNLGLGDYMAAKNGFAEILRWQNHHAGAFIHMHMIDFLQQVRGTSLQEIVRN